MAQRNKPKPTASEAVAPEALNSARFDADTQAWQEEMAGSCAAPALPGQALPDADADPQTKTVIPNPYPFQTDKLAGVILAEDRQLRRMQLMFDEKPSDEVRMALREGGFKWNAPNGAWEVKVDREQSWTARAAAEKVYKQVTEMIRQERGHTQEAAY